VSLTFLTACTIAPMRHKADVGTDAYAVVAADGDGGGDLYAVVGAGNDIVQLTWTPVREYAPALSPDGGMLAFLRAPRTDGRPAAWVMNLVNGNERELPMADTATETLRRLAWSSDGQTIYAQGDGGLWRWLAPPTHADAAPVPPGERAAADSALSVLVGEPAFARVTACDDSDGGVCVETPDGRRDTLSNSASAPARWGGDSLAMFSDGRLEIRPLAGGAARQVRLRAPALNPASVTYFAGKS
jgi:hypothetical protein